MLRFHHNGYVSLTIVFLFMSMLADTLCSMDVSRSPDSLIPMSPFPVPRARVLVRPLLSCAFPLTRTIMDSRLVSGYLFVLLFPLCAVNSYTYTSRLCLSPFDSSTCLCLPLPLTCFLL